MEKFLKKMVDLLDTEVEITMDTSLAAIEEWDSLSVISFSAMADIEYGKKITVLTIKDAKTIGDLFAMVSDKA